MVAHIKRASSVTEITTVRKITQEVDKAPSPWQYLVEGIDIQKNYAWHNSREKNEKEKNILKKKERQSLKSS